MAPWKRTLTGRVGIDYNIRMDENDEYDDLDGSDLSSESAGSRDRTPLRLHLHQLSQLYHHRYVMTYGRVKDCMLNDYDSHTMLLTLNHVSVTCVFKSKGKMARGVIKVYDKIKEGSQVLLFGEFSVR